MKLNRIYFNHNSDYSGFSQEAMDRQLGVGESAVLLTDASEAAEAIFSESAVSSLEKIVDNNGNPPADPGNDDLKKAGDSAADKVKSLGGSEEEQEKARKEAIEAYKVKESLPDYLSGIKDYVNEGLSVSDSENYDNLFKSNFNIDKTGATRSDYEKHVIETAAKQDYIISNHKDLHVIERIVNGQANPETLVRNVVSDRLKRSGIVHQGTIDSNVSEFFTEGALNEKGLAEFESIKSQAKAHIDTVNRKASEFAASKARERESEIQSIDKVGKTFNVLGFEIDEDLRGYLSSKAKLNNGLNWLSDSEISADELAERRLLLELVSDKVALSKFINKVHRKGELLGLSSKNKN